MSPKRKFRELSCDQCNNLDARNHENTTQDRAAKANLSLEVKMADLNGECKYCNMLHQIISDFVPDIDQHLGQPSVLLSLTEGGPANVEVTGIELQEEGGTVPQGETATGVVFYLCAISRDTNDHRSLPVSTGLYSLRSDTEECFRFVRDNLAICNRSHENCNTARSETALPKRVLDVNDMRLVEGAGLQGSYACLSHCWGKVNIIKTESGNLADMLEQVSWETLSNVFKDAITVCRYLKTKYIWIDSLCIIQDSKDDWETESAKMCDYYENAEYTISAASSPNGEVPFLTAREQVWLPSEYELIEADGSKRMFYARAHRGSTVFQPIEDFGPLSFRAWVWQEAVLSKRIVHYTPGELVWECASDIKTEDGGVPRGLFSMRLTQQLARCEEDPHIGWHDLVGTYSIRELTFETDRLPALSGVAKKLNRLMKSDYLAGLWRDNLLGDLCWSIDYASNPDVYIEPCPDEYLAPSWAWSSVDGPVVFEDVGPDTEKAKTLATVEDVNCTVPGLNPYGQVTGGYLVLRGRLAYLQINCSDPEDCWSYTLGGYEDFEPMTADCALAATGQQIKRAVRSDELTTFSCEAPCMLLRKIGSGDEDFTYYTIVLQRLEDGEYTRIGCALLDDDDWFKDALETVIRIV